MYHMISGRASGRRLGRRGGDIYLVHIDVAHIEVVHMYDYVERLLTFIFPLRVAP